MRTIQRIGAVACLCSVFGCSAGFSIGQDRGRVAQQPAQTKAKNGNGLAATTTTNGDRQYVAGGKKTTATTTTKKTTTLAKSGAVPRRTRQKVLNTITPEERRELCVPEAQPQK